MNELRKVKVIVPHIKLEKTNIHTRNKKARISCFNPNHIRHMNQVKGKPTIIHLSKTILAFGCREHPFKWETINNKIFFYRCECVKKYFSLNDINYCVYEMQ